jgi:hypothetical protein
LRGTFTRGRRAQSRKSIMKEIQDLWDKGFKEITLWDKTLTVTFVWRWFERFRSRYRNAKRQLL